jgi:hypothetical protein
MYEPDALVTNENVCPDEVIGRRTGGVFAQTRHASRELELAVVSEHGDHPRQLARRGAERGKSMQNKAAHGGRTDHLDFAGRAGGRLYSRRVEGAEELPQEQGVAPGRSMTGVAEFRGRIRAQPLPRQRQRGGLTQRSRIEQARLGARRHLRP